MRRRLRGLLAGSALLASASPCAADSALAVTLCYNYGCAAQGTVHIAAEQFAALTQPLRAAADAQTERRLLAPLLGQLYALAARDLPIGADRGGNLADAGADGRMDCIDHATSTTRWLAALAAQGALRHHRIAEPLRRGVFFQHFSAHLIDAQQVDWAVDTWFGANAEPARIMPAEVWRDYGEDDVW